VLSKLKLDRAAGFVLFHLQNFKSGKSVSTSKSQLDCSIITNMELSLLEGYGAPKTDVKRFETL